MDRSVESQQARQLLRRQMIKGAAISLLLMTLLLVLRAPWIYLALVALLVAIKLANSSRSGEQIEFSQLQMEKMRSRSNGVHHLKHPVMLEQAVFYLESQGFSIMRTDREVIAARLEAANDPKHDNNIYVLLIDTGKIRAGDSLAVSRRRTLRQEHITYQRERDRKAKQLFKALRSQANGPHFREYAMYLYWNEHLDPGMQSLLTGGLAGRDVKGSDRTFSLAAYQPESRTLYYLEQLGQFARKYNPHWLVHHHLIMELFGLEEPT